MKQYNIIIYISTILLTIFIVSKNYNDKIKKYRNRINNFQENLSKINDSLTIVKSNYDDLIFEKQVMNTQYKNIEKYNKELYTKLEQIKEDIGIDEYKSSSQIKGLFKTKVIYDTVYQDRYDTIIEGDSVNTKFKANYEDSVFKINNVIFANILYNEMLDSILIDNIKLESDLSAEFELYIGIGYKDVSKNIFQKVFNKQTELVTTIKTNDERVAITDINRYEIEKYKKKKIQIEPCLFTGLYYDPFNQFGGLSIGVGIGIIRN